MQLVFMAEVLGTDQPIQPAAGNLRLLDILAILAVSFSPLTIYLFLRGSITRGPRDAPAQRSSRGM